MAKPAAAARATCRLRIVRGAIGISCVRLLVGGVAEDERRPVEPRQEAQRVPDRLGDPVPVAGLPVHEGEPVGRVHLHVRAEQVRAEVGAVVDDAVEERLRLDALAHEAPLHVRDRHDQRVDPAVPDHGLELLEHRVPGGGAAVGAHRPSSSCGRFCRRTRLPGSCAPPPAGAPRIWRWYEPGIPRARIAAAHFAVIAPSATMTLPVTNDASSDARNSATFAISRGSPGRPIGWNESIVA